MFLCSIQNLAQAEKELKDLGVDPAGIALMHKKMIKRIFKIKDLEVKAANLLKQEALGVGAELALPRRAASLKGEKTDAILIFNLKQFDRLYPKLKKQPYGLKEVGERLKVVLENLEKEPREIVSGRKKLSFKKPLVMGILNITPDSFYEGSRIFSVNEAVKQAAKMILAGADILDIGGESTGPGSILVSEKEELRRVIPVIKAIRKKFPRVWLSIDTYKTEVARQALQAGVDLVNDVTALRGYLGKGETSGMAKVVAEAKVPVVLMYSKDKTPRTSREKRKYEDAVEEILEFLAERVAYAQEQGIKRGLIIIDPGMGAFVSGIGKYSLEILKQLEAFKILGLPILTGPSRKSFIGEVLDLPAEERLEGSLACAAVAVLNGAKIIRVHDVKETRRVVDMAFAISQS